MRALRTNQSLAGTRRQHQAPCGETMPRPIRRRPGFDNNCPGFKTTLPVLERHRPGFETACPASGHRCPGLECRCPDFQDPCPGYDGHCPAFFQSCPDFLTFAPDLKGLAPISIPPLHFHKLLFPSHLSREDREAGEGRPNSASFSLRPLRARRATPFPSN